MKYSARQTCLSLLLILTTAANAQDVQAPAALSEDPPKTLSLAPVGELTPNPDLSPLLRGARNVRDPSKWKASLYPKSGRACTATLIGPQVLLLAAHCIAHGGTASFELGAIPHSGPCDQADGFRNKTDLSADYALCNISPAVTGIDFERVNQDAAVVGALKEVLLSGFGCTASDGTGGRDGTFRIGESPIHSLPGRGGNIIVTKGGAALCIGDSGGAVFSSEGSKRRVLAVNVRADADGAVMGETSRVASLSSDAGREFLASWLKQHDDTKICGIGVEHVDCRR